MSKLNTGFIRIIPGTVNCVVQSLGWAVFTTGFCAFYCIRPAGDGKRDMVTEEHLMELERDPRSSHHRNIVFEIRVGVLAHDFGPFTSNKESGVDGNLEVLFSSPKLLEYLFSPPPHIGVVANSSGGTIQAYWGLTWVGDVSKQVFLGGGGSFGGAIQNGKKAQVERPMQGA